MRKRRVLHDAFAKEGRLTCSCACAVKELIGNHHVQRRVFFLKRADGRSREYPFHSQQFQSIDVGSEWNFGGGEAMPATMTRQKGNPLTFECSENEFVRRIAEWSLDFDLVDFGQLRHLLN